VRRRSTLLSIGAGMALTIAASGVLAEASAISVQLYEGSCEEPGVVVASLSGIAPDDLTTDGPAEMDAVARALGSPVMASLASVPMALADFGAGVHAIGVFDQLDELGDHVACGQFGGFGAVGGDVQVGLVSEDGSGMHGVAWLHDNGDGTTVVSTVVALPAGAMDVSGDGDDVDVAIRKSLYLPSPLQVTVGTTVTWTNEDLLPHTSTATQGGFDSGYMAQGDRFSQTFDMPGEFPYYCVYHPRMRATVIVS